MTTQSSLTHYSSSSLPTQWGTFHVHIFRTVDHEEHMAICKGDFPSTQSPLIRIHSACFTGEALGSLKCDCKPQLESALHRIEQDGLGMVLYLFQEGRGIGLGNKIKAYALQNQGFDTVDANVHLGFGEDERTYEIALDMLRYFQIKAVRLLTNNPLKVDALEKGGIEVVKREAIEVGLNQVNSEYLETKQKRMGHLFQSFFNESSSSPSSSPSLRPNLEYSAKE